MYLLNFHWNSDERTSVQPDLPFRLREDLSLNAPDVATFYGATAKGYTDYPFSEEFLKSQA